MDKNIEPCFLTVGEAAELIKSKEISPVDLVKSCLQQIDQHEDKVKAWVTVYAKEALVAAERAEKDILKGNYLGKLHGICYGVKDIVYVKDKFTAGGSVVEPQFRPTENAEIIERLSHAGAILLGKTTTTEYAFLWGNQKTRNPWNMQHTPGGSSSGSGAAVAASMAMFAIGTQTVGSLIRPASYNGLTCLKNSYGRVSRYGVIPASWSLDHIGVLTKSVVDTAIINSVISGYDKKDRQSLKEPVPAYEKALKANVKDFVIGVPDGFFVAQDNSINIAFQKVEKYLSDTGFILKKTAVPKMLKTAAAASDIVMKSEAAAYHRENFKKSPERFGKYIRKELMLGLQTRAVDYLKAQQIRTEFEAEMESMFDGIDVMITPSTITLPPVGFFTGSPLFNGPFTNSGLPVMTVPIGFDEATNLPIGMQIGSRRLAEEKIIAFGSYYQDNTQWHKVHPQL